MEPELDLATLLRKRKRSAAQRREMDLRVSRALQALSKAYPEQYRDLYNQAKAMVEAESGPLLD